MEQYITVLDGTRRPISLCIILDSSESMRGAKQRCPHPRTVTSSTACIDDERRS